RESLDRQQIIIIVKKNLAIAAAKRKKRHDMPVTPMEYKIGDLVLVRSHQLFSGINREIKQLFLLYSGPHRVRRRKMQNAYILEHMETWEEYGTHNVIYLKPCRQSEWRM
ncbi:MAG: hypothetical protein ACEY3E_04160, partial [Candidatus Tisiphia sp.]